MSVITAIPIGICEDVPIFVANVTILTDFVTLEMPEDDIEEGMEEENPPPKGKRVASEDVITHKYRGSQ